MLGELDHVGVAVADVEAALYVWTHILGLRVVHDEHVAEQGTRVIFLEGANMDIELLVPLGPETPVGKFLTKRGPGIHHLCFVVDDLEAALAEAKAKGLELVDEVPRIGAKGKRLAFIHPKSVHGVLIELCERHS
ncbi:MAG: methylmalonyl-CoA epimerase [Ardenticatenia bacterium]|nr:methylmalonyl-CoA epimerase [Ardenticatenia bacterium]